MKEYNANLKKLQRHFIAEDFVLSDWSGLEPYIKDLQNRPLVSLNALMNWLKDLSEFKAVVGEDACWRQIKMTCDTENEKLRNDYTFFCVEIQPKLQEYMDIFNRKFIDCPFVMQLDQKEFFPTIRSVKNSIELFRQQNVALESELSVMEQEYGNIAGKMTISLDEKEYTLQQASKFLESKDRSLREKVYKLIQNRRLQDESSLNQLYNKLVTKRQQVAINAGFDNYRDFKFRQLDRFDYTKEDCFLFHQGVKQYVMPLVNEIYQHKKDLLGLNDLRPWDIEVEPAGLSPLHPFKTGDELIEKGISCFSALNPFFGDCLRKMKELKRFDLESRKGKAPGGYNCPLPESGSPFIFMNASGQLDDVITIVHEGGHAIQSFLTHALSMTDFKEYPMEVAELASMSMELISMNQWKFFFKDPEELKRAEMHQLERVITLLPWVAVVDKFQHWVYENPSHTEIERSAAWISILDEYASPVINYEGLDQYRKSSWQRQLHLFEVPFYYIEYGIAQLGAIGMWKQYIDNPANALENYMAALSLGNTRTLPELYQTAGLRFDFSPAHIKSLTDFVRQQMDKLV